MTSSANAFLSRLGFRVLRVGNDDVYRNLPDVLSTALAALEGK